MTSLAVGDELLVGSSAVLAEAVDVVAEARRIAKDVAAPNALDVDRGARFPKESIAALREARLLGAMIPEELGGLGAGFEQITEAIYELATECASSAMIFAMHQLQVACLIRHGDTPAVNDFLGEIAARQLLVASSTTEAGIGGQLRQSNCAVEVDADCFRLRKQSEVISYGAYADAILVTARRDPDSAPNEQVLVICVSPGLSLAPTSEWDVLGLRGTCSPGFVLEAHGRRENVLPTPFAEIARETMTPVSHLLWAFVWLGIASAAESRARRYVQAKARKNPGTTPPAATRLAELGVVYRQMQALAKSALDEIMERGPDRSANSAAIVANTVKIGMSAMVVDVVSRALLICGMAGYREGTPYSLGRQLRDAHSAALMVNNDRLLADNAQMLMLHREAR